MEISSLATQMGVNLVATNSVSATGIVARALAARELLKTGREWPVILSDSFTTNRNNWPTGIVDPELTTIDKTLQKGVYHWQATAKQGFTDWATPDLPDLTDFYAVIDGVMLDGPDSVGIGSSFRQKDENNYYFFDANALGKYSFYQTSEGEWYSIISETAHPAIHPRQTNRIEIVAQGTQFTFWINGELAATTTNQAFGSGSLGLVAGIYNIC